jgi:S-adenosyl methyltransferase
VSERSFSAEEIDTSRAHPARMYDYYLGGQDNYEVDREAAQRVIDAVPDVIPSAVANREFLRRAVRFVAGTGIRQFVDIGTGMPTPPNPYDIARSVSPDVNMAYVDNDPIVAVHAEARLTSSENTGFFLADIREPRGILEHPALGKLIDLGQPLALMILAVLHFVTDDEDPHRIVGELREALPAGSLLILSHVTADFHEGAFPSEVRAVYDRATASLHPRTKAQVAKLFDGFEMVKPGLVQVPLWRPDGPVPAPDQLRRVAFYGGVGVKR